jgi:hypothetical protein
MTLIARCALEYWRASGLRTHERLRSLVKHFAQHTHGEMENLALHEQSALADVSAWELQQ